MKNLISESERLRIKKFSVADNDFVFELVNSPSWLEMIGDRYIHNNKAASFYIRQYILSDYKANGYGFYKVELKHSNIPIGLCGITKRPEMTIPDFGFALLPDYQGFGYMKEACANVLEYARKDLYLQKINAFTSVVNIPCQTLLQKLDFHFTEERYEPLFQSWVKSYQYEV